MVSMKESNSIAYGRRLIPHLIDKIAAEDPQRESFQIPRSDKPKDGWRIITFKTYANAINRCAHRIVETCGPAPDSTFPTIAYIGPQDARYLVLMVAAVKAGYQALFISPRNSQEGQINLFNKTDCHILWFPPSQLAMVEPWLKGRNMNTFQVDSLEDWLSPEEVPDFPYKRTFEQAEWEPLCVLHTSGSTGLPKPIVVRQGMMAISDAYHDMPNWQGYTHWVCAWAEKSKRHFVPMPLFHAAALYLFVFHALYWDTPIAFPIIDRPLSSDLVIECLDNLDVELVVLPPSILEDMSQSEEGITALKKLNMVSFGGGSLGREAGDRLLKSGVILNNTLNSTECAPFPVYFQPRPDLWQYFIFNDELFGCEWRKADDDAYELVVVRKDKHPGMQGFFYTFPDKDTFSTGDLYKPHPTLPNYWTHHGRADNVIVFSNGEKLNPVTIEDIIQGHPRVGGALVVGAGRFQPALLIEPLKYPNDEEDEQQFIDDVWPFILKANRETVAHGRITRELIAITNPSKPFTRSGKGAIQRPGTVKLYVDEINRLYERVEQGLQVGEALPLDVSSEESLIRSIEKTCASLAHAPKLDADTNFFSVGIDSMQVINASRVLRTSLKVAGYTTDADSLSPRVVYNNPTPRRLAQHILNTVIHGKEVQDFERHELQTMEKLYVNYTRDLVQGQPGRSDVASEHGTVLLTGSTGMLGSYLLHRLARNARIRKVICLNRAEDGGAKQQAAVMRERGLSPDYTEKTEFYKYNIGQAKFGLSDDVYSRFLMEVDRVIHNAWPVDFNISTETFEPHLRGVRSFADFAAQAHKRVAVIFISSVSTTDRWDPRKGPVPEENINDFKLPGNGYGRSKMVGSLILQDAAEVGDFPAASIRIGQIAGPESDAGVWNRRDWLPSLIESSLYLAALPKDLGQFDRVDWTPIERIAQLVLDVSSADPSRIHGYFHGVNSRATSWGSLAPAVRDFYGTRIKELIPFTEWVARLESSASDDTEAINANPGLKLLDTYRDMARGSGMEPVIFDMQRTSSISPAMKETCAITSDLIKHWCAQWDF
ncbi:hypothetical protein F5Y13DRAFT_207076 [Hypoxylon sp. FL1857]|nr:hypothetical protein F5Y13DRAFT_207076 [Hypoxylon sp. FL1857]